MKETLNRLTQNEILTREEARSIMTNILFGKYAEVQTAAFLTALALRGIRLEELWGMRDALCDNHQVLDLSEFPILDIVGTGGDNKNTFNISTCSCLVVAAAGYQVAKHGNYAATSICGASNLLESLGIRFSKNEDQMKRNLDKIGFTYLHAPLFSPGLKHVAHLRKALQIPTCFNILGPLLHPARPAYQILGTATLQQLRLYDQLLQNLDTNYGLVNSLDGYDEISLTGAFKIKMRHQEYLLTPADWHLPAVKPEDIYGGERIEDARTIFLNVLQNKGTEMQKNTVLANAALAIQIREPRYHIEDCLYKAQDALESGEAYRRLCQYIEANT